MSEEEKKLRTLFKFAGGKMHVVNGHAHLLPDPEKVRVYHEPFLGGGAVASYYVGKAAVCLNDKNTKLMAVYQAVCSEPEHLVALLRRMVYDKDVFYQTRDEFNKRWHQVDLVTRAAWFIYLNRTCFNGLYRENKSGGFNVPFGDYKNPLICDEETILAWSKRLRSSNKLLCEVASQQREMMTSVDFESAIAFVQKGDMVFLDPPYLPVSDTAKFTEYQAGGFTMADQERLAMQLSTIDMKGAKFLFTNAGHARHLYKQWNVKEVKVARAINSKSTKRGKVPEIFVSNYPLEKVT